MALVGKTELKADRDLAAGAEASILDLFTFEERSKQFPADQPVKRDDTKVKVKVAKFGTVEVTSDATVPQGFNASLVGMMKWNDMAKRLAIQESIKKNEMLAVTFES